MQVSWSAPSNIAFIKYWGKKGHQLPANASLSMTLNRARTEMSVSVEKKENNKSELDLTFSFEGKAEPQFEKKIRDFLLTLSDFAWAKDYALKFSSKNTFPHSTGIASSASSMSALALCLLELEEKMVGKKHPHFLQEASRLARLASGSACRSLYGGHVFWGEHPDFSAGNDEWATPMPSVHENFQEMGDAILVVSSAAKKVSSREGHNRMAEHPFKAARVTQAQQHTALLLQALAQGDWQSFQQIVQSEAMTLHALMMSAPRPAILMASGTLKILELIESFAQDSGLPLAYTLDAGPNVHLLYHKKERTRVVSFIQTELLPFCEERMWIDDEIGDGPKKL